MIVKIIGAKEDERIVSLLKGLPNVSVEFFDDEITFKNSFLPQIPIVESRNCLVFLLVRELPVASFGGIVSGKTNTTKIMINMRDKNVPLFNLSYFKMETEDKIEAIKRILANPIWASPITSE